MFNKRLITAVIGIPLSAYIINYGQWVFFLTVLLLSFLAWNEYCMMIRRQHVQPSYGLGLVVIGLLLGCAWLGNAHEILSILLLALILILAKMVFTNTRFGVTDAAYTLFGMSYIGLTFMHLVLLRFTAESSLIETGLGTFSLGTAYLWLAIIGTWSCDTAAYFVGTQFGRHKLCPAISPHKTIEGFLGGILGSVFGVVAVSSLFQFSLLQGVFLGLLLGLIAPVGDLAESAIKRFTGVKDSGRILPGHGGILDRLDSIMFAVPAVYYYTYIVIIL